MSGRTRLRHTHKPTCSSLAVGNLFLHLLFSNSVGAGGLVESLLSLVIAMVKADIVNRVAEELDVSRVRAARAVDTIIGAMKEALLEHKRIELRGFGVFDVRERKKGVGRNLKTGTEVVIPPGKTVRFKPGKDLRDL